MMNLITIFQKFPNQQACIDRLEMVRWPMGVAFCPFCQSERVARKAENERIGRWNCHECSNSFNVLSGTIFQGTHIELQKWFLAIALMADAKKSLSSYQLARDLEMNQKTAWRMQQCIRSAMTTDEGKLLQGIIEMDETYVGGKPRRKNSNNKRGRGASGKTSVVGVVERGGEVKAKVTGDTKGRTLLAFIQEKVEVARSALVTDEYSAYRNAGRLMPHVMVDHGRGYVDPLDRGIHTNTIEGFWALIKRAWYGSHHHYSRRYMPLFVGEACWKYNHRDIDNRFDAFLVACFK
jgi:transposase-like protein